MRDFINGKPINREPSPFRFNTWKHHLQWVLDHLVCVLNNPDDLTGREDFIENIKSINSNYVDIYTGQLLPGQIIRGIDDELQKLEITCRNQFSSWISQSEFQFVTLSDSSAWVLREGMEDELYIHVHPARNSPNVIRIHGNSWKTVIITKLFYPNLTVLDKFVINQVRKKLLNLSPIKEIYNCQRLLKAMQLLSITKSQY
jgi:hypothetical protein